MLNKNIKKRRLKLGLTLQQVGDAVGVTRATIQRYESGNIENIDTKMIMKLADVLQCTPVDLMGWETPPLTGNKKLDEIITRCYLLDVDKLELINQTIISFTKAWDAEP